MLNRLFSFYCFVTCFLSRTLSKTLIYFYRFGRKNLGIQYNSFFFFFNLETISEIYATELGEKNKLDGTIDFERWSYPVKGSFTITVFGK